MSNKPPATVRNDDDPRVVRSTHALGAALVELMHERDFDAITVQQILDRAGVGRATFYAHFRNKRDVLHSGFERMFGGMEAILDRSACNRVFPVEEFLDHVASAAPVLKAIRGPELDELLDQAVGYVGRIIEARIQPVPGARPPLPPALVCRMLASALIEILRWSLDRPCSNAALDSAFHGMALAALRQQQYAPARRLPRSSGFLGS